MTVWVVAGTGPLIGLGRVGLLPLLRELYGEVLVPPLVLEELRAGSGRPGSAAVQLALEAGWLQVRAPRTPGRPRIPAALLDPGEAAAILLAEQVKGRFLLIDDRRGRAVALGLGLRVVGVGGALVAAKQTGKLDAVAPALEALAARGYRLSRELGARFLAAAGEPVRGRWALLGHRDPAPDG